MSIAVERAYMAGRLDALQEVVDGIDDLVSRQVFHVVTRNTLLDIEDALREKIKDELVCDDSQ